MLLIPLSSCQTGLFLSFKELLGTENGMTFFVFLTLIVHQI